MAVEGFFKASESASKAPPSLIAQCGKCQLYRTCNSPKMVTDGEGRKGILIVGEAPGEREDEQGRPFVGPSGQLLEKHLRAVGIDLRRDCFVTNAAICRPPKNDLPAQAIEHCRPNVINEIKRLKPERIILLGASAVRSVIGWLWRDDVGEIGRWVGWRIPSTRLNCWICPTWHPSFLLHSQDERNRDGGVAELLFAKHLKAAAKLEGRPWGEVPEYRQRVIACMEPKQAAFNVRAMTEHAIKTDSMLAFDYETEELKPDNEDARIVSCSVSNGEKSVAFPWHGEAIEAVRELTRSGVPLIASNAKFEERWTRRVFGKGIKRWGFDTMLAAHILDNRKGVSSIKFQGFVQLGVEPWDATVGPYLKSKEGGGYGKNRIRQVSLPTLLHYNAMDSLIEYIVAMKQMKEFDL